MTRTDLGWAVEYREYDPLRDEVQFRWKGANGRLAGGWARPVDETPERMERLRSWAKETIEGLRVET